MNKILVELLIRELKDVIDLEYGFLNNCIKLRFKNIEGEFCVDKYDFYLLEAVKRAKNKILKSVLIIIYTIKTLFVLKG